MRLVITEETLRRLPGGVCSEQLEIFLAEWPEGVAVSEAACRRAHELGLKVSWLLLVWDDAPACRETYLRKSQGLYAELDSHCLSCPHLRQGDEACLQCAASKACFAALREAQLGIAREIGGAGEGEE